MVLGSTWRRNFVLDRMDRNQRVWVGRGLTSGNNLLPLRRLRRLGLRQPLEKLGVRQPENVNRKHAPKSEPAAILAAKKTFDMLLLHVGFFYSELDMWSFCDHD